MKNLILILVGLLSPIVAHAYNYDFFSDGIYFLKKSGSEVSVQKGPESYEGSIIIPEIITHDGVDYSVTEIGRGAFSLCENLTSITMPKSIRTIAMHAFSGCTSLTEIVIPESVKYLDSYSFQGCVSLKNIVIGDLVNYIGNHAFLDCKNLQSITLNDNIKSIESFTFSGCESLKVVNWGNNVSSIEQYAFSGCSSLESITIPRSVQKIDHGAFYNCINLRYLTIEDTADLLTFVTDNILGSEIFGKTQLESLYQGRDIAYTDFYSPFCEFKSLKSVTIGGNVTSIVDNQFYNCESLDNLIIANSVTKIGDQAFWGCTSLESVKLPSSLIELGYCAFYYCKSLTTITIPKSVESWHRSFADCNSLKTLILEDSDTPLKTDYYADKELFAKNSLEYVYLGRNLQRTYFYNQKGLSKVIIGNKVTEINPDMFAYCESLRSIKIPNSIKTIGNNAFKGCNCISQLTIDDSNSPLEFENNAFPHNITHLYLGRNCSKNSLIIDLVSLELGEFVNDGRALSPSKCERLSEIVSKAANPPKMNSFTTEQYKNVNVKIPDGSIERYITDSVWRPFFNIEIESISFEETDYDILINQELHLIPQLKPDYATENQLVWSSSDNNIASVNQMGIVSAHNIGTCEITVASLNNNDIFATCMIRVNPVFVENISINPMEWSGVRNESFRIEVLSFPENATDKTIEWSSDDVSVATVNSDGLVTAVGIGECIITASAADGSGVSASCSVTVKPVLVESISLDPAEWICTKGQILQVNARILPANADDLTLTWSSGDESVATVNSDGLVTAVGIGECIITASAADGSGVSASCSVIVKPVLVESISLDPAEWSGFEGEIFQINAIITPDEAENKTIEWTSSDISIATVDNNGLVNVIKDGSCIISARTTDGSDLSAECIVTSISGIDNIFTDADESFDIYNMQGLLIKKDCNRDNLKNLSSGIYIIRQDNKTKKIIVK